jgi:hypothetical protein
MATTNWNTIQLTGDPILVVGLRHGSTVEGYRLVIDKNVHTSLRATAEAALRQVDDMQAIPYTPYVEPQEDEYLSLDPARLTVLRQASHNGAPGGRAQQTARLAEIVGDADTLPTIGAKQLLARVDELYFQAICLHTSPAIISFITKTIGRPVLKRSAIPLGLDNATDRFKSITRPELVLEGDIHAIMTPGEIAILNRPQFQFLVGDIGVVGQYVFAHMKLNTDRFKKRGIRLSAKTGKALETKATASVQLAKRLDAFLERIDEIDLTPITNGRGFAAQDLKKKDFVNANGELECADERILEMLDALEGRFFDDGFTTEKRRADRFRKRP